MKLTPAQRTEEIHRLTDSANWPNTPLCPLKRPSGVPGEWPDFGVVISKGDVYEVIEGIDLFTLIGLCRANDQRAEKYLKSSRPTTPTELVDAGWVGD